MRRTTLATLVTALALTAAPALAQSVEAYDDAWYRADFWSGEYPNGFTVLKDTTLKLRPQLDPAAGKSIACDLKAKATYQQWNIERADSDGLHFVSFTQIDDMEVTAAYAATLYRRDDATPVEVSFEPGNTWRYLAYLGEGAFLMEYDGVTYDGDQSLIEVSKSLNSGELGYDEWMRINCPNNSWGWFFMGDIVKDDVTFTGPNITGYGEAKDLD